MTEPHRPHDSRQLLTNVRLAGPFLDGRERIANGALLIEGDQIGWVGAAGEARQRFVDVEAVDGGGLLLTPGLVDCHTHLVFGGNRAREFELRLEGASYEEIARAGGGILSTVEATRSASEEELLQAALRRVDALQASGVTTVEVKSGYGLDLDTELRCLRVARSLAEHRPITVCTSYLGAHALPPEFKDDRAGYLRLVQDEVLPTVAAEQLADAVDSFCEGIAFTPEEIRALFERAQDLGLPVKLHAEQLSNLGGASLAASFNALSADHLEYLDAAGVAAMAASGTVAVLLPGAFYYLKETQKPPVESLRSAEVPIALATDLNPGSSPVHSLHSILNMGCVLFGLTPSEALDAVTANAARALGLADRGLLAAGQRADLALWRISEPVDLCYPLGTQPLQCLFHAGQLVRGSLP